MMIAALRSPHRLLLATMLATAAAAGCAPPAVVSAPAGTEPAVESQIPLPPIASDSAIASRVAPGVVLYSMFRNDGPLAIHVLDVDRTACWMPAALKRDSTSIGRAPVSALLGRARTPDDTIAAVNADFFRFTPPGVPTGAHIDDGRVVTGPGRRIALAVDSAGRVHITQLTAGGTAVARRDSATISQWNQVPITRLGAFDENWGVWTDSGAATLQVVVGRNGRVLEVVRGPAQAGIPRGGWVLAASERTPAAVRRWLASLRTGDPVLVRPDIAPFHPMDAVGGFPLLVRDSSLAPVLDSTHVQGLGVPRHPRTAVGIDRDGRRLLLVVVDGRQPGYSAGMTLPELARLLLELGAVEALNLDGGGSSAMAVRLVGGDVHVVNRPSDRGGERAVANALAVVRGCPD